VVDEPGTVVVVVEPADRVCDGFGPVAVVVVDEVDSEDVDVSGADEGPDEVDDVVGSDEGEAGVVFGVTPRPAGRDAAGGAGRTSRYSTSVKTNAATRMAVERRTGSRISARARRDCSPLRVS
jgi:hypothetical protein